MDVTAIKLDNFVANPSEVQKQIADDNNWRRIPMLNCMETYQSLRDGQLVRFRGLIQDMLDPEIYLETFKTVNEENVTKMNSARYRDNIDLEVSPVLGRNGWEALTEISFDSPTNRS